MENQSKGKPSGNHSNQNRIITRKNMNIREYAEAVNVPAGKILTELQKKYPEQELKLDSELPSEFAEAVKKMGNMPEMEKPMAVKEGAITSPDEAFEKASYNLVQADEVMLQQAQDIYSSQSALAGTVVGYGAAMEFTKAMVNTRSSVLQMVAKQTLLGTEEMIAKSDESLLDFAKEASDRLGESVRLQQKTEEKLEKLRDRVKRVTNRIQQTL